MKQFDSVIVRHSFPNKYDQAPCGTLCHVYIDESTYEVYKQMSSNEERPDWVYLETITP